MYTTPLPYIYLEAIGEEYSNYSIKSDVDRLKEKIKNYNKEENSDIVEQNKKEDNKDTTTQKNESISIKEIEYIRYGNPRFGFGIDYPNILTKETGFDNGDGIVLETEDGSVKLVVSGHYNALFDTTAGEYEEAIGRINNVTYKHLDENFFVVSWEKDGFINYEKVVVGKGQINKFILPYPKSRLEEFNPIVDRLYNSFTTPNVN